MALYTLTQNIELVWVLTSMRTNISSIKELGKKAASRAEALSVCVTADATWETS